MHPLIAEKLIYRSIQRFRKEDVFGQLDHLEQSQWLAREELAELHLCQLKQIVATAYENVPFYREFYRERGVHPQEIKTLKDFANLPPVYKESLQGGMQPFVSANYKGAIESRKTSGSTGVPVDIWKGRDSTSRIRAVMYRNYRWYDLGMGDKELRLTGVPVNPFTRYRTRIQDTLMNRTRLGTIDLSEQRLEGFLSRIDRFRPRYLYGYPSAIAELALLLKKKKAPPPKVSVIITTGERLTGEQRRLVEGVFGCKVANEYGCCESGILAFECPAGNMHVTEDNVFVEILPIAAEKSEPSGMRGEIVVTELFNFSIPLIRYRLGDIATLDETDRCDCGRHLRILKGINGRSSEIINLPGGRKVHSEVFDYISDALIERGLGLKRYRVRQVGSNRFDVQILPNTDNARGSIHFLEQEFRRFFGEDCDATIRVVDEIPRDRSGKLRYFVPLVDSDTTHP